MPNLDLFGNVIASELPDTGDSKPIAGFSKPRPIEAKPMPQIVSVKESICVPYYVVRESVNLTWILHD
jgi:hypothetical protein